MYQINKDYYMQIKEFFNSSEKRIESLRSKINSETDIAELIDTIYCLRECSNLLEHMKKSVDSANKLVKSLVCLKSLDSSLVTYSTDYCSAQVNVKTEYLVPKMRNDAEKYHSLLRELGIDTTKFNGFELVRLHWPGFQEYCQDRMSKGLPVPENVQDTITEFEVSIRKKKEII